MRTFVLILAIGAVGLGAHHYHKRNPAFFEDCVDFFTGAPEIAPDEEDGGEPGSGGESRRAIAQISSGGRVDAAKHAAKKGRTIVEFTADW